MTNSGQGFPMYLLTRY